MKVLGIPPALRHTTFLIAKTAAYTAIMGQVEDGPLRAWIFLVGGFVDKQALPDPVHYRVSDGETWEPKRNVCLSWRMCYDSFRKVHGSHLEL